MLLQAREEKALPEMLIIAAGLSVPDPRERPEEQKEAAAAAHRAFADPDSDFLTLLNIWRASPELATKGGGNALRRFCKTNFLSPSRMREWRDIYHQLTDAVEEEPPASRHAQRTNMSRHPERNAASLSDRNVVEGPQRSDPAPHHTNRRGPSASLHSARDDTR
jgi:ATP-dependent helicase HrpA